MIVHPIALPTIGSSLAVGYAIGHYDLSAFAAGLVMAGTIAIFWRLDLGHHDGGRWMRSSWFCRLTVDCESGVKRR